jgi:hypothetical protein
VARIAVRLEQETGCPAQLMIAQWAIESAWGANLSATRTTSASRRPTATRSAAPCLRAKSSHYAPDFETVTVYYPWHPQVGQSLPVRFRKRCLQDELVSCQLPNKTTLSIPTWMLHPDAAQFALGPPQVAVGALVELRELLSALRAPSGCDPSLPLCKRAADEASNQVTETAGSVPPKTSVTKRNGAPPLPSARAPKDQQVCRKQKIANSACKKSQKSRLRKKRKPVARRH